MADGTLDVDTRSAQAMPRSPDFIIGGAPKCGTTSLHFILNQHPDIGIPDTEIHYFDADDPITHNDFFHHHRGELVRYSPTPGSAHARDWYANRFEPFKDRPFIGEDSTTYIFSDVAAARIAQMLPDVKLIFMLRHPVKRAWSQYWHMVNSARTSLSFEAALTRFPNLLLGSTYTPNLLRFDEFFPKQQIKIVLFEDFVADQQSVLNEVTAFLGAKEQTLDPDRCWFNKSAYSPYPTLQRALNTVGRPIVRRRYRTHMSDASDFSLGEKVNNKLHHWFFTRLYRPLLTAKRPPEMRQSTRNFLTQHLTVRNAGLSELLGRDLKQLWGLDV